MHNSSDDSTDLWDFITADTPEGNEFAKELRQAHENGDFSVEVR